MSGTEMGHAKEFCQQNIESYTLVKCCVSIKISHYGFTSYN
jgi:hypothetical protein